MLDVALSFLSEEFNAYLLRRLGTTELGKMVPGPLVNDSGKLAIEKGNVGACLINIEEERTTRAQLPERVIVDGREMVLPPELRLNLTLLFAANMANYDVSLRALSHVLSFFQAHSAFSSQAYPSLDPRIGKLIVELLSVSPEVLNQTWAYLGTKYLPSVLYRVRLVALQDREPISFGKPITTVVAELSGR